MPPDPRANPKQVGKAKGEGMTDLERTERAIKRLRSIGYPCELWTSGKRVGIVLDYQAADRLIQVHQPGWKLQRPVR